MAEILLVEDDALIRHSISNCLSAAGHSVRSARNGREAIGLIMESGSELIVTDIYMPELDGLELIRELRSVTGIPIVAMSGGGAYDQVLQMLQVSSVLGANEILQKPFSDETLLAAVSRALARVSRPAP